CAGRPRAARGTCRRRYPREQASRRLAREPADARQQWASSNRGWTLGWDLPRECLQPEVSPFQRRSCTNRSEPPPAAELDYVTRTPLFTVAVATALARVARAVRFISVIADLDILTPVTCAEPAVERLAVGTAC